MSVAERNLNPKAACLKRREEEKSEEQQAGRSMIVPPHEIGHQVPLVRAVFCYNLISLIVCLTVQQYPRLYRGSGYSSPICIKLLFYLNN